MRITHIMLAKGFGGAERSFIDLARALSDGGHSIQTICHRDFSHRQLLVAHPDIEAVSIPVIANWDPFAARRILRLLRSFKPQVVHAHLARAAHLGGQAARRYGVPTITKTHAFVSLKYYRTIDHFVTTTDAQQRYLLDEGIPDHRISIIPNCSAFAVAKGRAPGRAPAKLLSYGRMVEKKGFDVLLRAMAVLINQGADLQLELGGDGPERSRLEKLAVRLGIGERVAFIGWMDDVRAHLLTADVFILPSREEPFGIAVLEAMACRTPIVATRCDGPMEILDEETAVFSEPGNVESLSRALGDIVSAPDQSRRRADAAADRFMCRYTPDTVAAQYLKSYKALGVGDGRNDA